MAACIGALSRAELRARLADNALRLRIGPFAYALGSEWPGLADWLAPLYARYPRFPDDECADFRVRLRWRGLHGRLRRELAVEFEGERLAYRPFDPGYAPPHLEWGLNWGVAFHAGRLLMLHAAVVARGERALLLPAQPGSGKSTLAAALGFRGWRFLSDEFCLIDLQRFELLPFPRLVALKNASVPAMRTHAPTAVIGRDFPNTAKGCLAHLQPPPGSIEAMDRPAVPAWIVFPQFRAGSRAWLEAVAPERTMARLCTNAFNYEHTGLTGFETVARLVSACPARALEFGALDDAIAAIDALADGREPLSAAGAR